LDAGISNMVRIGGRSKNPRLDSKNLRSIAVRIQKTILRISQFLTPTWMIFFHHIILFLERGYGKRKMEPLSSVQRYEGGRRTIGKFPTKFWRPEFDPCARAENFVPRSPNVIFLGIV
jgi:hypothetical protein